MRNRLCLSILLLLNFTIHNLAFAGSEDNAYFRIRGACDSYKSVQSVRKNSICYIYPCYPVPNNVQYRVEFLPKGRSTWVPLHLYHSFIGSRRTNNELVCDDSGSRTTIKIEKSGSYRVQMRFYPWVPGAGGSVSLMPLSVQAPGREITEIKFEVK